jgi:predicted glycosyltransferase
MNILFEVNHPGQVHLLRHSYHELIQKGHKISVIAKEEKIITYLLDVFQIPYTTLGLKGAGKLGKLFAQFKFDWRAYQIVRKNKITLGVGSSITNDHLSFIMKSFKAIHLSDDDESVVPLLVKFSYPYTDVILSPSCLTFQTFKDKNIQYPGYHELAYLHPKRFQPNIDVIQRIGIQEGEKYFVLRFVALKGHHDDGHEGISFEQKKKIVELLKPHGRIFITSEKPIEKDLEMYRLPVKPEEIHTLLYYATLFLGDSQTMTTEAAILGVPALKCNTFAGKLSIPNEIEEKYDLCYSFLPQDFDKFYEKAKELIHTSDLKTIWKVKLDKLLSERIDVTSFLVWFIENYPNSQGIIQNNPDFQYTL